MVCSNNTEDSNSCSSLEELREYLELQVDFSQFSFGPAVQSYIILGAWLNEVKHTISTNRIEQMMNRLRYFPNDIKDIRTIVVGTWLIPLEESNLFGMSEIGIQLYDIWKKMVPESVLSYMLVIDPETS